MSPNTRLFLGVAMMVFALPQNSNAVPNEFDWDELVNEIKQRQALWDAARIDSYIYHYQFDGWTPSPCFRVPKYVLVIGGEVRFVEYDKEQLAQQGLSCDDEYDEVDLGDYHSMEFYFEQALWHAEKGKNANCSSDNPYEADTICGGSEVFECQDGFNYPTQIKLNYGPAVGNDGGAWTFDCFTRLPAMIGGEDNPTQCEVDVDMILAEYA